MPGIGWEIAPQLGKADVSGRSNEAARSERERLGIDIESQQNWKNGWEAFRKWRAAIERRTVLVFQFPMPMEDARGFSLSEEQPYVIVVNSSDAIHGRIFTLFHEYAHLLLHTPGVCLPRLDQIPQKDYAEVERWCNGFAGAFLIPDSGISSAFGDGEAQLTGQVLDDAVEDVAWRFTVSEQVALWRLRDLGIVSQQSFRTVMEELKSGVKQTKKRGGPVAPAKKCLAENGSLFTSLVLEARGRGFVTFSDVTDYLGVRLKHLPEIESSLTTVAA